MFQHLLESDAAHRPRVGGSLVSTVAHAALVAGAVALTMQPRIVPTTTPDPAARFIAVAPPPPPPPDAVHADGRASASSPRAVAPSSAILPTVLEIAVGVAMPDLGRPVVDAIDFASRRGTPGAVGDGGGGAGAGDGAAWLADQVDKPVLMIPGGAVPAYPALLRSAGVAGAVLVEFVVDTLGRVEPGSLRLVHADHELFAASVRDVAPRLRFLPAEARGHKVRQLVRLPFQFDVHPGEPNANAGLIRF